jgi:hypothetical protein
VTDRRPMPGDAVRLTEDWYEARAGAIGFIDGMVGEYNGTSNITFNARVFRDDVVVSSSGGPGSISTDLRWLRPTDEQTTVLAWRWPNGHRGRDNGEEYRLVVPLWDWTPSEAQCHLCGRNRNYHSARTTRELLSRLEEAVHGLAEVNYPGSPVESDIDRLAGVFQEYRASLFGGRSEAAAP